MEKFVCQTRTFRPYFTVSRASLVTQMVKNLLAVQETQVQPWVGKIPWRKGWQSTPVYCWQNSIEKRSLAGSIGSHRVRHN